MSGQALQPGGL